jgi:type IV pilus assembly protein PilM
MFSKNIAAVDIGSKYTKVLFGKNSFGRIKIKKADMFKTPEGAVESGLIKDVDILAESLKSSLKSKNIKPEGISFTVQGQDIVTRYIEVPVLDDKSTQQAVEWEIKQYLPDGGQGYYIAFENQDKVVTQEKKVYKTLVAAVPRDKIDRYVELSERLNIKIEAIDTFSNSAARVFKNISK